MLRFNPIRGQELLKVQFLNYLAWILFNFSDVVHLVSSATYDLLFNLMLRKFSRWGPSQTNTVKQKRCIKFTYRNFLLEKPWLSKIYKKVKKQHKKYQKNAVLPLFMFDHNLRRAAAAAESGAWHQRCN